jgi:hypothetical protein
VEQEQQGPWWRDAQQRNRVLLISFAVLALGGILFPAFTNYLFAGDRRVVVVTMAQDAEQRDRANLKSVCGSLPGVRVIADRGDPDPRLQGKFAVRFDVADITAPQYAALTGCISRQPGVRGLLTENDGN